MSFEFGIAFQSNKTLQEYRELGRLVDKYKFDVVSVYGDLGNQPPIIPLTIFAEEIKYARIGPTCLNPFTYHPASITEQIAALDYLSEGRAFLGIAPGAWLDTVGIEQKNVVQVIRESTEFVRHALKEEQYKGGIFTSKGKVLAYAPYRTEIPTLIGTWGKKLGELAGEIADEVKIGGSANPQMISVMRGYINDGARNVERDPDNIGIVLGAVSFISEDRKTAVQGVIKDALLYISVIGEKDPTVDREEIKELRRKLEENSEEATISKETLEKFALAGTPQDIIRRIERIIETGAKRIDFGTPHGYPESEGIKLLGEEVLPYFR